MDNAELASLYQRGLRKVRDLVALSNQEVLDLREGYVAGSVCQPAPPPSPGLE